jgi:prophage regulatory protein
MGESILRLSQVRAKTGLSRSALYAAQSAGKFPRSIALGARSVGWLQSEIDAWISNRIAASRGTSQSES